MPVIYFIIYFLGKIFSTFPPNPRSRCKTNRLFDPGLLVAQTIHCSPTTGSNRLRPIIIRSVHYITTYCSTTDRKGTRSSPSPAAATTRIHWRCRQRRWKTSRRAPSLPSRRHRHCRPLPRPHLLLCILTADPIPSSRPTTHPVIPMSFVLEVVHFGTIPGTSCTGN